MADVHDLPTVTDLLLSPPRTDVPGSDSAEGAELTDDLRLIHVQRLERDDGAAIIYLDATFVVAFAYPGEGNSLVLDVHRRTDDAESRLRVLIDGQPVSPPTSSSAPVGFTITRETDAGEVILACSRCAAAINEPTPRADLRPVLAAVVQHRCQNLESKSQPTAA